MAGGLTARQLRALKDEYGSLAAAAQARPELAAELAAVEQAGEQWANTFARVGPPGFMTTAQASHLTRALQQPPTIRPSDVKHLAARRDTQLLERIARQLEANAPAPPNADAAAARGGRPKGSYIGTETFWVIWTMAVDGHASARAIEKATLENGGRLEFVNRTKAGVIVRWVKAHHAAAKSALVARKLPRGFLATPDAVRLPDA